MNRCPSLKLRLGCAFGRLTRRMVGAATSASAKRGSQAQQSGSIWAAALQCTGQVQLVISGGQGGIAQVATNLQCTEQVQHSGRDRRTVHRTDATCAGAQRFNRSASRRCNKGLKTTGESGYRSNEVTVHRADATASRLLRVMREIRRSGLIVHRRDATGCRY